MPYTILKMFRLIGLIASMVVPFCLQSGYGAPQSVKRFHASNTLKTEYGIEEHRLTFDRQKDVALIRSVDATGSRVLELKTTGGERVNFRRYSHAQGKEKLLDEVIGRKGSTAVTVHTVNEAELKKLVELYSLDVSPHLKSVIPCEAECGIAMSTCLLGSSGLGALICMAVGDYCLSQCPLGASGTLPPGRCMSNGDCETDQVCQPAVSSGSKVPAPAPVGMTPPPLGTCIPRPVQPPTPKSCKLNRDCGKDALCVQGKCMPY